MELSITTIPYNSTDLVLYQRVGQNWLRWGQIVPTLGLTLSGGKKIFDRHQERFTDEDTMLLPLPTDGGMQEVRVFSMRGCLKLSMLARTPEAVRFHDFIADYVVNQQSQPRRLPPPPPRAVSSETWAAIREIAEWPEVPDTLRERLLDAAATGQGIPRPAELTALAEERLVASLAAAPLMKAIMDIDRRAVAHGFSKDALKMEMQLLKRLRSQPQLALEPGDA